MAVATSWALAILLIAIPAALLGMAIRHSVPLFRGINAPLWTYFFTPLLLLSDRFWTESARPHRKRFLVYLGAFALVCVSLIQLMPNP
jgi:hypothetical protein